jgi:hypothetical protein
MVYWLQPLITFVKESSINRSRAYAELEFDNNRTSKQFPEVSQETFNVKKRK